MKKKTRIGILSLLLAFCACLVFSGCGGSSGSSSDQDGDGDGDNKTVVLTDSGYSVKSSDSDVYSYWGATIKNESSEQAYEFSTITVTAYDNNGDVLASDDQTLAIIQPGEEQACAGVFDCNGEKPKEIKIELEAGDKTNVPDDAIISSDFEISGTDEKYDSEMEETAYTGKVKNNSDKDAESVAITVLLKKDGKIVYGVSDFVDNVKDGSEKAFDISDYDLPDHDSYEIYAMQWY